MDKTLLILPTRVESEFHLEPVLLWLKTAVLNVMCSRLLLYPPAHQAQLWGAGVLHQLDKHKCKTLRCQNPEFLKEARDKLVLLQITQCKNPNPYSPLNSVVHSFIQEVYACLSWCKFVIK